MTAIDNEIRVAEYKTKIDKNTIGARSGLDQGKGAGRAAA